MKGLGFTLHLEFSLRPHLRLTCEGKAVLSNTEEPSWRQYIGKILEWLGFTYLTRVYSERVSNIYIFKSIYLLAGFNN